MEKTITTHQAEVETFTVKVKVITVNNRKMTLSVFRQLERRDFVDRITVETRGEVWGRVNYHWDACGCGGRRQHIVWQEGDSIYRDCFGDMMDYRSWGSTSQEASYRNTLIVCGATLEALEQKPEFRNDNNGYKIRTPRFTAIMSWRARERVRNYWDHRLKAEKGEGSKQLLEYHADSRDKLRKEIYESVEREWCEWCEGRFGTPLNEATPEAIKTEAIRVHGVISEKKDKYAAIMKKAQEAPHLFIAV